MRRKRSNLNTPVVMDNTKKGRFKKASTEIETEVKNMFETLNDDSDMSDIETASELSEAKRNKVIKLPPIVVKTNIATPKVFMGKIKEYVKDGVSFKKGHESISIFTNSLTDFESIKTKLSDAYEFFTYTPKMNKPKKLVLKGIDKSFTPDEIKSELTGLGLKVTNVQNMFHKGDKKKVLDMFLVSVESVTNINAVIASKELKCICYHRVTWEKYRTLDNVTQCHRCQKFGHAAYNCNLKYRCVKCIGIHEPGKCEKTNKDTPATCVNCNENHPANYSKCKIFELYKNRKSNSVSRNNNQTKININNRPNTSFRHANISYRESMNYSNNLTEFPHINKSRNSQENENSNSFIASPRVVNNTNETFDFFEEIRNLFGCSLTEFAQKCNEFKLKYMKATDTMEKGLLVMNFVMQNVKTN